MVKAEPREKVLRILFDDLGNEVSGEAIARRLGISRSAVNKHIRALRAKGLRISSSTKKGYRLQLRRDQLFPYMITKGLGTEAIGNHVVHEKEAGSTNELARELALRGTPSGTVAIADRQKKGRGRLGRAWSSPTGGVWMSIVLTPQLPPSKVPAITLVAGIAVARVIERLYGDKARPAIKWPNDLLINGKKVCGILTELDATAERLNFIIMGIGINANFRVDKLPRTLRSRATTLLEETGSRVGRAVLVRAILQELEALTCPFETSGGNMAPLRREWMDRSAVIGRRVRVEDAGGGRTEGKAVDLLDDGSLVVEVREKGRMPIISGSLEML